MLIGHGRLDWNKAERITDRYGSIHLSNANSIYKFKTPERISGKHGSLVAIITETRKSLHIGDLFRGIFPETPNIGDRIVLGVGTVFFEDGCIGLKPDEPRESDWLDPHMLYRCHSQTIELYFEDEDEVSTLLPDQTKQTMHY